MAKQDEHSLLLTAPFFNFEAKHDSDSSFTWISQNWVNTIVCSVVYVISVYAGRRYMDKRQKYQLRGPLIIWNLFLSVFSIIGTIRTAPELLAIFNKFGFQGTVCIGLHMNSPTSTWTCLFAMSKAFELGDTAFIILRKQPLSFLHVYHHSSVLVYSWFTSVERAGPARWFVVMNFTVHSFMYTYYGLRASRINVPNVVKVLITVLQVVQMFGGIIVVTGNYIYRSSGATCPQSIEATCLGIIIYFSYLILFLNFFYRQYLMPKASRPVLETNGVENKIK